MNRVALFIDFKNLMSSEYKIDIFKIPNVIYDYLFKVVGGDVRITRTYVFISTPSTDMQAQFADLMVQNKFDVISLDYMDKAGDVAITTKIVSDAHKDIFDIGVIVSGNLSLYPAIREVRDIGKQILVSNFSDKINTIYKEANYETGPLDFDILYLDTVLDAIADKMIDGKITPETILSEVKNELFEGNIDFDKIDVKKYVTYWAVRARYLQLSQDGMADENKEIIRKAFDKLNDLSSEKKPGYIKALNKKWHPASWEDEIKMLPKVW
jgi:hypothetical protein